MRKQRFRHCPQSPYPVGRAVVYKPTHRNENCRVDGVQEDLVPPKDQEGRAPMRPSLHLAVSSPWGRREAGRDCPGLAVPLKLNGGENSQGRGA